MILIDPMIDRNDQRKDIKTPLLGVVDWAQCKGNCFQNMLNFLGRKYKETDLKQFAEMDTFTYYNIFESWLLFTELEDIKDTPQKLKICKERGLVYDWNMHLICNNLILEPYKLKLIRKNSNLNEIIEHINKTKQPVITGTWLSPNHGHIITVIGFDEKNLICSDPYGVYPYGKESEKTGHNGYMVKYPIDLMRRMLTKGNQPTTSIYLKEV